MATTETKIILNAETGQAVKNVRELQDTIKAYKQALADENATAEENRATAAKLAEAQGVLRDVMNSSNLTLEEARKGINTANMSYNDLVHTMADLTKVWRSTTDEVARAQIGSQINQINNKLKELDATKGTFQRNVGNYGNQLGQAFTQVGSIVGGPFQKAVMAGNNALKVMSANPIMLILTAIVTILQKVIDALKSSEENANAMNTAMAAFAPIGDAVTKILQAIGSAVAWVVSGLSKLVSAIIGTTEAMAERQRIAEMEIELTKRQRENIIKNAEAERDAARLKAEAAEKDKLTSEERLALLEESAKKENEIAQRAYEDAKLAYEIQKAKNALTASSAEEKQKEAEAYAAMVKAETDYYKKIKETASQMAETRKKMADDAKKAAKERQDALRAQVQAEKDLIEQEIELAVKGSEEELRLKKEKLKKDLILAQGDARTKIKDKTILAQTLANLQTKYNRNEQKLEREHQKTLQSIRIQGLKNIANRYAEGTLEYLKAMADVRKQEMADVQREEGETMESYHARRLASQKAYYDAISALNKEKVRESTLNLELAYAQGVQSTENALAFEMQMAEARAEAIEKLGKQVGETEADYLIRLAQARNEAAQATDNYINYTEEQERLHLENRMNTLQEGSLEYLSAAIDLKAFELDTLHKMEEESDEEFYARKIAAEKAYIESKKALTSQQIALAQQSVSAVSGILGSLADIYESDTDATEAELKKAKNMRIAGATIDMLSGVVTAISTAMQLGPIAGPIMGAINSAAVIAAGVANITKIKQQSTSKNASSSQTPTTAQVSAPVIGSEMQAVRNVTSASEEDRLNQMASDQRVVLVMSDLEVKQAQKRVQVAESSF